ncbi:MAG: CinA protein [Betaproteobacteria bacterium]|nr:CinA protein [Betaproteobacteria bacterium]
MSDTKLYEIAAAVGVALKARKLTLATAESCTGGWIGEACTAVPGSSDWFERGFITYTNIAKREMLGVKAETLDKFGAVSEETVEAMVGGALAHSHAQVAIAVSGVAGPSGGTPAKPVGTVCIAWQLERGTAIVETQRFDGDREAVRRQSVERALNGVLALLASA